MIDEDALAEFARTNMGWLTANGAVMPCRLHNHVESLSGVAAFAEAYGRYEATCAANEAAMNADLDSLGPDDHPAMHRFDGMDDEARDALIRTVYETGWIRLGRAIDRVGPDHAVGFGRSKVAAFRKPASWLVEAEGLTGHVRARVRTLDAIARHLGARLVTREMRYASLRGHHGEILVPEGFDPDAR